MLYFTRVLRIRIFKNARPWVLTPSRFLSQQLRYLNNLSTENPTRTEIFCSHSLRQVPARQAGRVRTAPALRLISANPVGNPPPPHHSATCCTRDSAPESRRRPQCSRGPCQCATDPSHPPYTSFRDRWITDLASGKSAPAPTLLTRLERNKYLIKTCKIILNFFNTKYLRIV